MTSQEIQRKLAEKVTMKMLDHEVVRFSKMSTKQLTTRLFKITNLVKLEAFRAIARELGLDKLANLAREKRDFMHSG